jgi:hypothetical protein
MLFRRFHAPLNFRQFPQFFRFLDIALERRYAQSMQTIA